MNAITGLPQGTASLIYVLTLIAAFAIIGFGLKYIDDAFDEARFSKKRAMIMAPLLVVLWACLSIYDAGAATVLFSILFAVLLSGKVDNPVFKLSSIALLAVLFVALMSRFSYVPLVVLTVMGVVDEKGNDYVDGNRLCKLGEFFFAHRCGMKLGSLGLCLASFLPWLYLLAFLAFDSAYELVKLAGCLDADASAFGASVRKLQLATILLNKFR
jgi:hypothetical protein